jgi:phenylalanyl-tRNA synthetase beta chain
LLQEILVAVDQRPINNVVDITNYVMFEYAQPLHAFDFRQIAQKKIVVRRLAPGEKLELLGGKTIDPGPANARDAGDLRCPAPGRTCGGDGGQAERNSLRHDEILLEAAHFDPPTVRRTAKRIEVSTESSYRFERGCDPNRMLEGAMARAAQLLVELAGGKLVGFVDAYPKKREPRVFKLSAERTSKYLGNAIDDQTIRTSLTKLEMKVEPDLAVTVPTWRMDAVDPAVLIEDVARLVGYDALPMRPTSQHPTPGKRSALDALRQELAGYLSSVGYFECRSPSLDAPEQVSALLADESQQVKIKNP